MSDCVCGYPAKYLTLRIGVYLEDRAARFECSNCGRVGEWKYTWEDIYDEHTCDRYI